MCELYYTCRAILLTLPTYNRKIKTFIDIKKFILLFLKKKSKNRYTIINKDISNVIIVMIIVFKTMIVVLRSVSTVFKTMITVLRSVSTVFKTMMIVLRSASTVLKTMMTVLRSVVMLKMKW